MVNPIGEVSVVNMLVSNAGRNMIHSQDVLYAESGEAVSGDSLVLLGKYAASGAFVVDEDRHRVLFMDYRDYANCRVKVFDRDSFAFITSVLLPPLTGTVFRFKRCFTTFEFDP